MLKRLLLVGLLACGGIAAAPDTPPGTLDSSQQDRNGPPSLWRDYRGAVLAAVAVGALQAILIAALLLQRIGRRRAESELRHSEERYREVVDAQTELVCRYARDGTLTFVNPAYCRYFGRSSDRLIGHSLLDLVPAFERDAVRGHIETLATTRQPIMVEHRVVAADGSVRWQQWVDYAVLGASGSIAEFQGIGRDITERRQMEESLRQSEAALRVSYENIRQLAGRLISAQEEERARIARDLHDDIGQRVASVSIALSRLKRQVSDSASPHLQPLADLQQQVNTLSADLRHLSHHLHPSALEHLGLLQALRARCEDFRTETGVSVQVEVSDAWRDTPDAAALCLYRVAQEALRNVAAHADAQRVTVALDCQHGQLLMAVTDDGRGFDSAPGAHRSGMGLISLGERVRMLGGTLDVQSAPGAGTRVAVSLPAGQSLEPSAVVD